MIWLFTNDRGLDTLGFSMALHLLKRSTHVRIKVNCNGLIKIHSIPLHDHSYSDNVIQITIHQLQSHQISYSVQKYCWNDKTCPHHVQFTNVSKALGTKGHRVRWSYLRSSHPYWGIGCDLFLAPLNHRAWRSKRSLSRPELPRFKWRNFKTRSWGKSWKTGKLTSSGSNMTQLRRVPYLG